MSKTALLPRFVIFSNIGKKILINITFFVAIHKELSQLTRMTLTRVKPMGTPEGNRRIQTNLIKKIINFSFNVQFCFILFSLCLTKGGEALMDFISQYFDDKNYSKWLIIKFGNQRCNAS